MNLNPLAQINIMTIVSIMVIFAVTLFVLKKIFFNPYIDVIEARYQKITNGQKAAQDALTIKGSAREEVERIVNVAKEEAELIAEKSRKELAEMREQNIARATAQADKVLAKGRIKIDRLRESEAVKLDKELTACVTRTLVKLVGPVDEKAVKSVVDRCLAAGQTPRGDEGNG